MHLLIPLHLLAALIWVGGMFFAYVVLRPSAAATLEPPLRLTLWAGSFKRFFPWVWASIIVLLASGLMLIFNYLGGFAGVPAYVHIMFTLGLIMMAIFMHVFFAPYRRLRAAVDARDWETAGKNLNQIRRMVGINLLLGLITTIIASAGRYLA